MQLSKVVEILSCLVFVTAAAAQTIDPSQFWSLVDCSKDNYDFGKLVNEARRMAQIAFDALERIANDQRIEIDYKDSDPWSSDRYLMNNAAKLWGVTFRRRPVPGNPLRNVLFFDGLDKDPLNSAKEKFKGVIDALDQGNFWRKEINWVICMQTQTQAPFVKANLVKDWVDLYPEVVGNTPIGQYYGKSILYYPNAGYLPIWILEEKTKDLLGGRRRIALVAEDDQDACHANDQAFVTVPEPSPLDHWLALCPKFYGLPTTIASSLPESATEPERYLTQAIALLHERKSSFMHFRYPEDVVDLEDSLADMNGRIGKFYGFYDCTCLAGAVRGGSSEKALKNADNYAMWTLTAALPGHKW